MEIWEEPVRGGYPPEWLGALSGRERNNRFEGVSLPPPIHHLTGSRPVDWGAGVATAIMPASR